MGYETNFKKQRDDDSGAGTIFYEISPKSAFCDVCGAKRGKIHFRRGFWPPVKKKTITLLSLEEDDDELAIYLRS